MQASTPSPCTAVCATVQPAGPGTVHRVRRDGDWEAWLDFVLRDVTQVAEGAVATAERLGTLFQADRQRIEGIGRRAGSVLRVHEALKARPIQTMSGLAEAKGLSFPAASAATKWEPMGRQA